MTDSEIYLRAAEMIDEGKEEFACFAIERVQGGGENDFSQARRAFESTYRPKGFVDTQLWTFECHEDERGSVPEDFDLVRVLSLLLMSEMTK